MKNLVSLKFTILCMLVSFLMLRRRGRLSLLLFMRARFRPLLSLPRRNALSIPSALDAVNMHICGTHDRSGI